MNHPLLFLLLSLASPALAAERVPYTFDNVTLVECIDGDTCRFDFHETHPVLGKVTFHGHVVRLADVDTPESYRPECEAERELGDRAKDYAEALLRGARRITVVVLMKGRYGRLIARVLADGVDVSQALIEEGLGRPYDGGKRKSWC